MLLRLQRRETQTYPGKSWAPVDPIHQQAPTSSISLSSIPLRSSSPPSAAPSVTQTKIRTDTLRKFAVMHIFTVNRHVPEGRDRNAAARQVQALLPQHFSYEASRVNFTNTSQVQFFFPIRR